eukprot:UN15351
MCFYFYSFYIFDARLSIYKFLFVICDLFCFYLYYSCIFAGSRGFTLY